MFILWPPKSQAEAPAAVQLSEFDALEPGKTQEVRQEVVMPTKVYTFACSCALDALLRRTWATAPALTPWPSQHWIAGLRIRMVLDNVVVHNGSSSMLVLQILSLLFAFLRSVTAAWRMP